MRIVIVSNGTRGDAQPYAALGAGLRRAGYDVRAVAPAAYAGLFEAAGLPVAALPDDGGSPADVARLVERGTLAVMRFMAREMPRRIAASARDTLAAAEGADMLLGGVGGMVTGLGVAERLGVPFVEAHLQPIGAPSAAYPGVMTAGLPRWFGRLGHRLSDAALWMPFRRAMGVARRDALGLRGRVRFAGDGPILYGFSRHVVPVPAGGERMREVTGYWTASAPDGWAPPAGLDAFLTRGGPVVSIGFGSMGGADAPDLADLVRGAARDAGVRAVLLGTSGDGKDGDLFRARFSPHEWLFPRVTAAVHHGGAGTTGAAIAAGIPAVIVPFAVDQPFWGERVRTPGVGPAPVPRRRLSRVLLANALRSAAGDDAMRARAAALGAIVRAEDGVAAAVEAIGRIRRSPA